MLPGVVVNNVQGKVSRIALADRRRLGVDDSHARSDARPPEFDPRWAVAEIASRFQGTTSHALRQEFAELRSRLPTLWSRSYYAGTVGHVSEGTVRRYIEAQKTR